MPLPPNPHPIEVFRCALLSFSVGKNARILVIGDFLNGGYLEKPVSLAFRGALRGLSIGERVNHQRLTLQLIMSLPPNPHPIEVFRCAPLSSGATNTVFIPCWQKCANFSDWRFSQRWVPRKTSFASFSRCPAGLVYWGRGLTINGLRYS